jgi:hypothetical protein
MIRRFKYALLKEYLYKAVTKMESWQKVIDPSWFLIMMVSGQHVDNKLSGPTRENKALKTASGIHDSLKENPQQTICVFTSERIRLYYIY